jgi:itaconate CoA-transferase
VAAPFATRHLADLGARVIKIERPKIGDFARGYDKTVRGQSSHFIWLNRSKESLTLDLKHDDAMTILHELLENADVFVQNLAPGAAKRLYLDGEHLTKKHPRLIVCNISGFGPEGPYANKKAYDLLVQAETGLLSITGTADTPSKTGISAADIAAGMYAFSGIQTALFMRERSGAGTVIDVSMFDALSEWMGYPAYYTAYGGTAPSRSGARHATIAPYGPYRTKDEKIIMLGIQNEREWQSFCTSVIDKPELANDPRFASNSERVKHREQLERLINDCFKQKDRQMLLDSLDKAQIANASLNDMQQFWEHPQLKARNRWRTVDTPQGAIATLLPPVDIQQIDPRLEAIPGVGEHTHAILKELGYTDDDIQRLSRDNVV